MSVLLCKYPHRRELSKKRALTIVCMYLMIGKGQIAQKDHIGAEIDLKAKCMGKYVFTLSICRPSTTRCNHVIVEFRQLIVRRGFILKRMLRTVMGPDGVIRKR